MNSQFQNDRQNHELFSNRREFLRWCVLVPAYIALEQRTNGAEAQTRVPLLCGQIGVAHAHASGKMQAMRNLPLEWRVVGVSESDPKRRQVGKGSPYYGLSWMTEEELLAAPGLCAVAVETEVKDLVPTAMRVVRAGKHIHLDKPAGESLGQFRELLAEAGRRDLTVQMGYMYRYNPGFQLLYRFLAEGWLGRVMFVEGVMTKWMSTAGRPQLLPYRGGVMFEVGCHLLDAVVKVLGKPKKVHVHGCAHGSDELLDDQLAVLEYERALATVRASVVEHGGEKRRSFTVVGEKGTFEIRPLEAPAPIVRLTMGCDVPGYKKGAHEIPLPKLPRFDGEFLDLSRVIRGEKVFEYSHAHDLAVQETVLRASGMPVN
ncbi:MAG: Gfo/Idh/MocA family oxidoreductase [Kiritimatiellae bacterium]|nr:Gfo/Idh/MocA family oxidoreductase [Kiritimatiellia bacterium]MDD5519910.1 Gfo/Idh/MocA family oxidoreductase [Kiritimatiellia bacterium]